MDKFLSNSSTFNNNSQYVLIDKNPITPNSKKRNNLLTSYYLNKNDVIMENWSSPRYANEYMPNTGNISDVRAKPRHTVLQ